MTTKTEHPFKAAYRAADKAMTDDPNKLAWITSGIATIKRLAWEAHLLEHIPPNQKGDKCGCGEEIRIWEDHIHGVWFQEGFRDVYQE